MPNTSAYEFSTCVVHKLMNIYLHECMKYLRNKVAYGDDSHY